jgi:Tol biopolymer transport system component
MRRLLSHAAWCAVLAMGATNAMMAQSPLAVPLTRLALDAIVSTPASLSADGRYVAFVSHAALVPADGNDAPDIYVLDRTTGQITLESVTPEGRSGNGTSMNPHISGDGRWLLFETSATNLMHAETRQRVDIVLRDRLNGTLRAVSQPRAERDSTNGEKGSVISADGRVVAFVSHDSHLVDGVDANGFQNDVYVLTLETGRVVRASVTSEGVQPAAGSSFSPAINADGTVVAFSSTADLEHGGAALERSQIFVRDLARGTTRLVSAAASGGPGNQTSHSASISSDGRFVAFASMASNLGPADDNRLSDIYVRDLQTGVMTLVSHTRRGKAANGDSSHPAISGDGRFVAFVSESSDLACGKRCGASGADSNLLPDIYLADLREDTAQRVSGEVDRAWWAASQAPAIDEHGAVIVFPSKEPIGARDLGGDYDLFIWIRVNVSSVRTEQTVTKRLTPSLTSRELGVVGG